MANREIYLAQIVKCGDNDYWYKDLIGRIFYVVVIYQNNGEIDLKVINNQEHRHKLISYPDTRIVEKVTRVRVPRA